MAAPRVIPFDDGKFPSITKLKIKYDQEGFVSIKTRYVNNDNGQHWSDVHGTRVGDMNAEVTLDSDEYLISLSGYFHTEGLIPVVDSLTFQSNRKMYGPFGTPNGTYFSTSTTGRIVGFHGTKTAERLNSIGAHFGPLH